MIRYESSYGSRARKVAIHGRDLRKDRSIPYLVVSTDLLWLNHAVESPSSVFDGPHRPACPAIKVYMAIRKLYFIISFPSIYDTVSLRKNASSNRVSPADVDSADGNNLVDYQTVSQWDIDHRFLYNIGHIGSLTECRSTHGCHWPSPDLGLR